MSWLHDAFLFGSGKVILALAAAAFILAAAGAITSHLEHRRLDRERDQ